MVEYANDATKAIVTMDGALPGIIWGSIITVNMWAKSIGTGVLFVAAFLWFRHNKDDMPNMRWAMPVISFIALTMVCAVTS